MALLVGIDTYVTVDEFVKYAGDRGYTIKPGDEEVLLARAMDFIEIQPYSGSKNNETQILEFPRNGSATVPERIKTAQMVAAIIYGKGNDPLAPTGRNVINETVVGAVSVSYSGTSSPVPLYPQLLMLLRDFVEGGGNQMAVNRA